MKKIQKIVMMAIAIIITNASLAQAQQYKKMGCATVEPESIIYPFDTVKGRGFADNYYLWDNGKVLKVKIMTNSPRYKALVMKYAKEWEKYANIKFDFIEFGDSHIRVVLTGNDGGGNYSMLGTQANLKSQDEHTLHLDTTSFVTPEYTYTAIVHEFGHAIGLMHEHMSPVSGIKWDKNRVYASYKLLQGWDKDMVDAQLFRKYNVSYTNGTKYDKASIMHYPISRWETLDGYFVNWNYKISEGDKALIAALYPKTGERKNEVPRFEVLGFSKMDVEKSDTKQGVSFFPSFTIKTAGKQGRVYYLAVFRDADGNMIPAANEDYKIWGGSGTLKSTVLMPSQQLNINKGTRDLELFIPYSAIPDNIKNKNIKVTFHVFLFDNDEFKLLYTSKPLPCNMAR